MGSRGPWTARNGTLPPGVQRGRQMRPALQIGLFIANFEMQIANGLLCLKAGFRACQPHGVSLGCPIFGTDTGIDMAS
jgi:hypothetical protein